MASTVNLCVGAVVALGGVMGYAKKRSIPSLAAGGGAGLLYIVASRLIESGQVTQGLQLALAVSGLLSVVMARRAMNSGKFMPAGLIATVATGALLYNGLQYTR